MSVATLDSSDPANNFKHIKQVEPNAQYNLVKEIAVQQGFTDFEIELKFISNKGGNYLGDLFEALIRGKKDNKTTDLHLFLKVATSSDAARETIPLHDVYCNEIFAYKVLSPLYFELQLEENIPDDKMFLFPKFYGSLEGNIDETLVLENLSHKNYAVQDRFKSISLDFAEKAVDNLAKFHALSYVMERRDPNYFDQVLRIRTGDIYLDNGAPERLKAFSDAIANTSVKYLRNKEYTKRLTDFCKAMCDNIGDYVKTNKHPALCHGDYRGNNMLVRNKNDSVESIIPIDYQFLHFGSPLNDFIYFIYTATDKRFRDRYLDYLIQFYYKCLGDFLELFSYNVSEIYPKASFDEDTKSHLSFGLVVGVHILQFVLASADHAPELEDVDNASVFEDMAHHANDVFLQRFNEIIEEFVQRGHL